MRHDRRGGWPRFGSEVGVGIGSAGPAGYGTGRHRDVWIGRGRGHVGLGLGSHGLGHVGGGGQVRTGRGLSGVATHHLAAEIHDVTLQSALRRNQRVSAASGAMSHSRKAMVHDGKQWCATVHNGCNVTRWKAMEYNGQQWEIIDSKGIRRKSKSTL